MMSRCREEVVARSRGHRMLSRSSPKVTVSEDMEHTSGGSPGLRPLFRCTTRTFSLSGPGLAEEAELGERMTSPEEEAGSAEEAGPPSGGRGLLLAWLCSATLLAVRLRLKAAGQPSSEPTDMRAGAASRGPPRLLGNRRLAWSSSSSMRSSLSGRDSSASSSCSERSGELSLERTPESDESFLSSVASDRKSFPFSASEPAAGRRAPGGVASFSSGALSDSSDSSSSLRRPPPPSPRPPPPPASGSGAAAAGNKAWRGGGARAAPWSPFSSSSVMGSRASAPEAESALSGAGLPLLLAKDLRPSGSPPSLLWSSGGAVMNWPGVGCTGRSPPPVSTCDIWAAYSWYALRYSSCCRSVSRAISLDEAWEVRLLMLTERNFTHGQQETEEDQQHGGRRPPRVLSSSKLMLKLYIGAGARRPTSLAPPPTLPCSLAASSCST
ncbi:hypothetical protein EYF80_057910 [Liparis tanakae]|uniref:Uncharacterized protein n=1 Tax=Liparis tanakae TaxID=230148 RepID=A0A4Z2EUI2_9TELE|nr:hypothetical protein EYF80_057910 [Liparis tanakae]